MYFYSETAAEAAPATEAPAEEVKEAKEEKVGICCLFLFTNLIVLYF